MPANPAQTIVRTKDLTGEAVGTLHADHRNLPEIRAEGETARAAATKLGEPLQQTLAAVSDSWHRASLEQAIEDLRAYVSPSR